MSHSVQESWAISEIFAKRGEMTKTSCNGEVGQFLRREKRDGAKRRETEKFQEKLENSDIAPSSGSHLSSIL